MRPYFSQSRIGGAGEFGARAFPPSPRFPHRHARTCSGHPLPPPPLRPLPARTAMPQDVDARNESIAVRFRFSGRVVRRWAGTIRAGRAFSGHPLPPAVMPGLVPGIHVPPPPRPRPARTAMPHGVDARNKSGHDAVGEGGARPRTATGDAGVPKSEPRPARSAGNPLVLKPFAPPERIKPDSNGTSPGMTTGRKRRTGECPPRSAFADGNADKRVESAEIDIPARHPRDANVDPVAICLPDAYVGLRKTRLRAA